jgi:hypothetical protein
LFPPGWEARFYGRQDACRYDALERQRPRIVLLGGSFYRAAGTTAGKDLLAFTSFPFATNGVN